MWDPLRPKYPINMKSAISGGKKEKNRERPGRGTLNTCAKLRVLSLDNGVDNGWTLNKLGAISLKQPVEARLLLCFSGKANASDGEEMELSSFLCSHC